MENLGKTATNDLEIHFIAKKGKYNIPYYGMLFKLNGEVILDRTPDPNTKTEYCDVECFINFLKKLGYNVSIKEYD